MKFILVSSLIIVLGTIFTGVYLMKKEAVVNKSKLKGILKANILLYLPLFVGAVIFFVPNIAYAATAASTDATSNTGLGFIAAALSTGMATIGAGYAVGAVGSSALGAVSEDQKILGKTLIFVGLAEGIAIYGLIISILILGRL
ncbi:MAG: ATPase [Clostridiales bacterium]|nr:ATPase [Clostridiales bacterium]